MNRTVWAALILTAGAFGARAEWYDDLKLKGDVRWRLDNIQEEGKDDRYRNRFRVRLGAFPRINQEVSAGIQVTTAEEKNGAADPISGNVSFSEAGTKKGVFLDLGYIDYHPLAAPGLSLVGGKMKNPFIAVGDYLWDNDYTPEGLAANYAVGDKVQFLANGGYLWMMERAAASDSQLYSGQLALQVKPSDESAIKFGGSYYGFADVEGQNVFDWQAANRSFGNSTRSVVSGTTTSKVYATEFQVAEGFVQTDFDIGIPVSLFGAYAVNTDADSNDTGWQAGIKFGNATDPGQVDFAYDYRHLEKDVWVGALADSDFNGGGTDCEGHRFRLTWQIRKNFSTVLTYYVNDKKLDNPTEYKRMQFDFVAKF